MILQTKYKSDNKVKKEDGKTDKVKSSHYLEKKRNRKVRKFITFDSESDSKFYYNNQEITREEYYKNEFKKGYWQEFIIRTIQATFSHGKAIKRKIYIKENEDYNKTSLQVKTKTMQFSTRIIKSKNIIESFIKDCINFSKDGKIGYHNIFVFAHNVRHDWLQIGLFNFHKDFNLKAVQFNLTIPYFVTFELMNYITEDGKRIIYHLTFIDSLNYFKEKLEDIGQRHNIAKRKDLVDFKKGFEINDDSMIYGIIDAEIIRIAVFEYITLVNNFTALGYGVPSTSYNIWRSSFLKSKIWLHKNYTLMQLERAAYFGGRTEVFKLGYYTNLFGIDINSSYPYSMTMPLPGAYKFTLECTDQGEYIPVHVYKKYKKKYLMLVEAVLTTNLSIPLVPHHNEDKQLLFVNCTNRYKILCQPEIDKLIELNQDVKILKLHCYEMGYYMRDYVQFFMGIKEKAARDGDLGLKQFAKLSLNSPYGKTAERYRENVIFDMDDDSLVGYIKILSEDEEKNEEFKCLAGIQVRSIKTKWDSENGYSILGSFITSYSRMNLYNQMLKIGRENLVYTDTDSIYFINNNVDFDNLNIDKYQLGCWDIEDKNINMLVLGAKDYYKLDDNNNILKQKLKGVSLKNAIYQENNLYLIKKWQGFCDALRHNQFKNQRIEIMEKRLQRDYKKAFIKTPDNKQSIIIEGKKIEYIQSETEGKKIEGV
jgi:hypothetical protein